MTFNDFEVKSVFFPVAERDGSTPGDEKSRGRDTPRAKGRI